MYMMKNGRTLMKIKNILIANKHDLLASGIK